MCVRVCVRACVRACVCACVRACVRERERERKTVIIIYSALYLYSQTIKQILILNKDKAHKMQFSHNDLIY